MLLFCRWLNDVVVEIVKASPVTAKLKEIRLTADDGDDDVSGFIERSVESIPP